MDEETREIRAGIADTRGELADTVSDLSERLAPRRQAERAVTAGRDAAVERVRSLSLDDLGALAARIRSATVAHPGPAAACTAAALLLMRRRRHRR